MGEDILFKLVAYEHRALGEHHTMYNEPTEEWRDRALTSLF